MDDRIMISMKITIFNFQLSIFNFCIKTKERKRYKNEYEPIHEYWIGLPKQLYLI